MPYIFGKLWHLAIIWPIGKPFQCILQGVRFLLANHHSQLSGISETFSYIGLAGSFDVSWWLWCWGCILQYTYLLYVLTHTSYLSQTPRVYSCKFFLAGVNFYRFNAKNWHYGWCKMVQHGATWCNMVQDYAR